MINGDEPEHHEEGNALLVASGHEGQPHEVQRAVRSVRGNGAVYLFVLCNCGAEVGFQLKAAPTPTPEPDDEVGPALFTDGEPDEDDEEPPAS